jgi:CxxC-x17-CxxC domain-containing protein
MAFENRGGFDRGPREMHKAVCTECGKECEVPFKPTEGKPVLLQRVFRKEKSEKVLIKNS